jgi:hypothetical protein
MTIEVVIAGSAVPVEREVFVTLFENSVVNDRADVRKALASGRMTYEKFVKMSRTADIPYPLFFAPLPVVQEQLRIKTHKLMSGFTKDSFSMNSRNRLHLADVELIVKDLIRKQQLLKADPTLHKNAVVGLIRRPGRTVADDSAKLMNALEISRADIRKYKPKARAVDVIVEKLEAQQVLVSRSAKDHMPQRLPARAKFSGMTIKDAKVPYIFLASGDEGEHLEPAGRKVFTLTLLSVLLARGTFAPVTYDGHTNDTTAPREYEVTAEILMPELEVRSEADFGSLDAIKDYAEICKVTPSAVVMRGRRLGILNHDTSKNYLVELAQEYGDRIRPRLSNARPANALRNYNGTECSRRMLGLLDAGEIKPGDFCRVMFFNKLKPQQIPEFRAAVG